MSGQKFPKLSLLPCKTCKDCTNVCKCSCHVVLLREQTEALQRIEDEYDIFEDSNEPIVLGAVNRLKDIIKHLSRNTIAYKSFIDLCAERDTWHWDPSVEYYYWVGAPERPKTSPQVLADEVLYGKIL